MKEVTISLIELTKEEAAKLPDGKELLVYNSFMNTYKIHYAGHNCIARIKYAASYLRYFIFDRNGCDG